MAKKKSTQAPVRKSEPSYDALLTQVSSLLDQARRATVRATNAILTATYWQVGRQIVEFEQDGTATAEYGEKLLIRLAKDLTSQFGRGFSRSNLQSMRLFYLMWQICQTLSGKFEARAKTAHPGPGLVILTADQLPIALMHFTADTFPLPWSHYVRLMSVKDDYGRAFYEDEAIIAGWSVRQLNRMISTQHYERTALSKNKAKMLLNGREPKPEDTVPVEELIRDPYVLEFLNLKDEYSESELEEAIVKHLEAFLLEMGRGFTFVARQFHFRIDHHSFRMDLVLFHRVLRCLVIVDLKIGEFNHADAGQMNLYLNYAKDQMKMEDENDPIGLILCSEKSDSVVKYAMGGIDAKVFSSRYLKALPDPEVLRQEMEKTKHALETRKALEGKGSQANTP